MSETVNTNHNQMGKSSNSGKSLVKEKEKFQREKEGGRAVEGWDSILTQMSFFSLGTRRRLYVTLKVPSPRLLERNSKPFFSPLIQQPQQQRALERVRQSRLCVCDEATMMNSTSPSINNVFLQKV